MQGLELFATVPSILTELEIPYMITGSVAVVVYGEPRVTHDVDLVVEIPNHRIDELCRAFPPGLKQIFILLVKIRFINGP